MPEEQQPDRKGIGGPKTEEGKAISSMNAVKHGMHVRKFNRIGSHLAGRMKICDPCGADQQLECRTEGACLLHKELIYRYHMAHSEKDPTHIEEITIQQLATMDLLFNQKLRWIIENAGEVHTVTSEKGVRYDVPIVKNEDYFLLMNMANNLAKSLPDMQLTRQTQEQVDVAFAMLLKSKVEPQRAEQIKARMLGAAQVFQAAKGEAGEMESQDAAIQSWIAQEKKAAAGEGSGNLNNIGESPFGEADQQGKS